MALKVAVTGASGFVGRHVVKALLDRGAVVVAASRQAALPQRLPKEAELVHIDMAEPSGNFDRLGRPDVVVHLAWEGLPNYGALRHFEAELPRQYTFLRVLVEEGAKSLVVAGTCLEYGMQSGALAEESLPAPCTPYALAKHVLHQQLDFLRLTFPFSLTWARLFYLYGQGQAPTSLWSQLQAAIQRGEREFNMSAGEQLRDFLPIEKAAALLARLALLKSEVGTVNICSGKPTSVRALVEECLAAENREMKLNLGHHPYPVYEPMAFWGSANKLKATLGEE